MRLKLGVVAAEADKPHFPHFPDPLRAQGRCQRLLSHYDQEVMGVHGDDAEHAPNGQTAGLLILRF